MSWTIFAWGQPVLHCLRLNALVSRTAHVSVSQSAFRSFHSLQCISASFKEGYFLSWNVYFIWACQCAYSYSWLKFHWSDATLLCNSCVILLTRLISLNHLVILPLSHSNTNKIIMQISKHVSEWHQLFFLISHLLLYSTKLKIGTSDRHTENLTLPRDALIRTTCSLHLSYHLSCNVIVVVCY